MPSRNFIQNFSQYSYTSELEDEILYTIAQEELLFQLRAQIDHDFDMDDIEYMD